MLRKQMKLARVNCLLSNWKTTHHIRLPELLILEVFKFTTIVMTENGTMYLKRISSGPLKKDGLYGCQ